MAERGVGLAEIRKSRGVTQVALAAKMGITQESVSRIERAANVRHDTVGRYIEALGGRMEMEAVFEDQIYVLVV